MFSRINVIKNTAFIPLWIQMSWYIYGSDTFENKDPHNKADDIIWAKALLTCSSGSSRDSLPSSIGVKYAGIRLCDYAN
ncbi:hypothetical protein N7495_003371 [Penicillium taxi]|uniref:uncharacterized protein n=1 Tax=Penicillium taxi TaxID=168475 RepID=UPI0025454EC3|nr:uncharacterized protein N7495_003371 [Penicillium taxi]KAJ5902843.1 hypothetical protein N7495_003371 [Penicillium taxi]